MNTATIMKDGRPIKGIVTDGDSLWLSQQRNRPATITAIVPYVENGEMAPVIWFAIFEGEVITDRINGKYVIQLVYV